MITLSAVCLQFTVWKFHNFSVIQIFGEPRRSTTADVGQFRGSGFYQFGKFHPQKSAKNS